jgi:hypothetical protein
VQIAIPGSRDPSLDGEAQVRMPEDPGDGETKHSGQEDADVEDADVEAEKKKSSTKRKTLTTAYVVGVTLRGPDHR